MTMSTSGLVGAVPLCFKPPKRWAPPLGATMLVCALQLFAISGHAIADNTGYVVKNVPRAEVLQLPQFCWARYIEELQSAEYRIPRTLCGDWTNHYCDALLVFSKVKRGRVTNARERSTSLYLAREGVIYTLRGTEKYPGCPIRQHVESTLAQIDSMLRQNSNVQR